MRQKVTHSKAFIDLNFSAKALLIDIGSQFSGFNNGDLCAAFSVMKKRGWKSETTLMKARKELVESGFIQVTRQGGRNCATLYALTFYAIMENRKFDEPFSKGTNSPSELWAKAELQRKIDKLIPNPSKWGNKSTTTPVNGVTV